MAGSSRIGTNDQGIVATLLFQSFIYLGGGSSGGGRESKGRHFDRSVILLCIRSYLAYRLSLRDLREIMAERGISADHAPIHSRVVRYRSELLECFDQRKKASVASGTSMRHT